MSLADIGNVLYYGVLASFFGGWVIVRSKDLKLIVFHLYMFLSLLALPLLIVLVNGSHPVGWIVYSLFTGATFICLKVLNFRLHKALGTDPLPEEDNEEEPTPTPQEPTPTTRETNEAPPTDNINDEDHCSITENNIDQNIQVVSVVNEETTSVKEDASNDDASHSGSTLNDTATARSNSVNGSAEEPPTIELSSMSHEAVFDSEQTTSTSLDQEPTDHTSSPPIDETMNCTSPVHRTVNRELNKEDEPTIEVVRSRSGGARDRICQRMSRNESINNAAARHEVSLERDLADQVRDKLLLDNHPSLVHIVNRLHVDVQQAIMSDTLSSDNYESLKGRVEELSRGHLASSPDDSTAGAIHWIEENGLWDFYVFDSIIREDPLILSEDISDEFWRMHFQEDPTMITPYRPSSVPSVTANNTAAAAADDAHDTSETCLPSIMLLPYVKWSTVDLKFARSQLEDYMDRNVTIVEVVMSIVLAVLVCVVGSLLFTLTNFFQRFSLFWLCYVIATSQFSLIKSVQSDASSPGPGQNRINAISRATYFVFVGCLGLVINAALNNIDNFTPFCLFGFDFNNRDVLMFVRNGLFTFLLFFPLLFTIGWMPQFDTFIINLFEQIDVHVFGGTASTGLVCGIYAIGRSLLSVALLVPLGYASFYYLEQDTNNDVFPRSCENTFAASKDGGLFMDQCTPDGRIALSFFLGGVVSIGYFLSRSTSNHQYLVDILQYCLMKIRKSKSVYSEDPLDRIYRQTMLNRLKVDTFVVISSFLLVTVLNITSVFCQTEILLYVSVGVASVIGVINHYLLPHSRKENPYLCFMEPCLKSKEYSMFEVTVPPKVSWAEKMLQVTQFLEKNVLYPVIFLLGFNFSAVYYKAKFGNLGAAILTSVVGLKIFRTMFCDIPRQHVVLILTFLFFKFDYQHLSEGLPLDYFVGAIFVNKIYDLYLKTYFMLIYILPSSWSHPFHILIQPLLIPHCSLIFFQAIIGAVVSAPMNPVIASSMFFLSYARPIKFWEKNYNTKRQDITNTRLEQTLDGNMRNPNPDQLDSLFYEQLTWSLQRDLCGDISLGRWGRVTSGDIFILTNDQLNALVHIIEVGNGFVTFQLRGLEFRGTYCHQREREAITEPLADEDDSCHLPFVLPCSKSCTARWMAWEVISSAYTLHGYSISENQAHLVFNAYVYKKAYITYYVRCIIYYLIKCPRLDTILKNDDLKSSLAFLSVDDAIDLDPLFTEMHNIDWQSTSQSVAKAAFISAYYDLIKLCCDKAKLTEKVDTSRESFLVTLCFAFSLLGRRMFFTHASTGSGRSDNFMHGLYRMFIGDARPNSEKDDWIFQDIDSIQEIIIPATRIALKVHQDNFTMSEHYEDPVGMYEAMVDAETSHVITHENDRSWRNAVVLNKPSLLALRYQRTEDSYVNPYKIIRLNSKFVKFRLIKVNRECVRGLWSSQQHELIFLRNSDSERGSIQNHKASLRNMINSSMDLPIGYPIYVSPLQTSFLDQHISYNKTIVGQMTNPLEYTRIIDYTQDKCSCCVADRADHPVSKPPHLNHSDSTKVEDAPPTTADYIDPFGDSDEDDHFWDPIWIGKHVTIMNVDEVFETFNEGWLKWPDKAWLNKATISHWKSWRPVEGVTSGKVIHEWRPFHITSTSRSHIDKLIVLIKVDSSDNFVLVKEKGIGPVAAVSLS